MALPALGLLASKGQWIDVISILKFISISFVETCQAGKNTKEYGGFQSI
jgi:hypothetical protein